MYRSKLLIIALFLIGITVTGFECASTELTSARLYIQQKNYTKALTALQEEVQKNPKSDEGYYLLGYVNGELGNFKDMVDAFDKSIAISKQFESNINDSRKYFWAQAFNHGVAFFQKANTAKDKDSAQVDYGKSATAFELAGLIEPDSIDTYKNLAFVYINQQDYDKAMVPLQKIIDKEHGIDGYRYLGEILYDKATSLKSKYQNSKDVQDSVKAQEYYNQAIDLLKEGRKYYPDNSELLLLLSNSYIGAHKIDIAISAFKEGVAKEPGNKYYHYNYGVLLLGNNDFQDAETQFKQAIQIDSAYQNAIFNLAVTYVKWGTYLNKIAQEKDEKAPLDKSKYEQALPYLEHLVQMKNNDASLWELLGKVYTVLGEQQKAQSSFQKADDLRK